MTNLVHHVRSQLPALVIYSGAKPLVKIHHSGEIDLSEGCNVNEAAHVFWDEVQKMGITMADSAAHYRKELAACETALRELESKLLEEASRTAAEKRCADQMAQQRDEQAALNRDARDLIAALGPDDDTQTPAGLDKVMWLVDAYVTANFAYNESEAPEDREIVENCRTVLQAKLRTLLAGVSAPAAQTDPAAGAAQAVEPEAAANTEEKNMPFNGPIYEGVRAAVKRDMHPVAEWHPDTVAVYRFAEEMASKMEQARAKGLGGWETCPPEVLSSMLRKHVEKGDPRDVANFCMMLWHLGQPIAATQAAATQAADVQWWLATIDQYGNPALTDGAHSARAGADKAAYLIDAMGLGVGKKYAVARVELSEPKPSADGVNHEAIAMHNRAAIAAQATQKGGA